jgi:hypothetical protein
MVAEQIAATIANKMTVIQDKVKFLDKLKCPLSISDNIIEGVIGVVIAIALVIFVPDIPEYFILILLTCYVVVLAIYAGYLSHQVSKPLDEQYMNTPLAVLGEDVSMVVFLPVMGMVIASPRINVEEVKNEMMDWGYSEEYIKKFIEKYNGKSEEEIKDIVKRTDKWLKRQYKREKGKGKLYPRELNKKGLSRKSVKICERLYRDR